MGLINFALEDFIYLSIFAGFSIFIFYFDHIGNNEVVYNKKAQIHSFPDRFQKILKLHKHILIIHFTFNFFSSLKNETL